MIIKEIIGDKSATLVLNIERFKRKRTGSNIGFTRTVIFVLSVLPNGKKDIII